MSDIIHKLRILGPGALSAGLANYAPDPDLPGPLGYVPGPTAVEGVLGVLGHAWDAGRAVLNGAVGTNLPPAPQTLHDMNTQAATTEQQMYEQLGGAPSITYTDELLRAGASMAGNLLVPGLGWIKAAKYALAGGGIGAGSQAAMDAVTPEQPDKLTLPPGMFSPTEETTPQSTPQVADKSGMTLPPGMFSTPETTPAAPSGPLPPGMFTPTETATGTPHALAISESGPAEMTVWQGVVGLLTLGAVAASGRAAYRHGAQIGDAERIMRANDPTYLKEANDYKASVVARGSGTQLSETNPVDPPLPPTNPYHKLAVGLQDAALESGTRLQDFIKITADNPRNAQRLAHQVGVYFDEQQKEIKFRQFLETGHDPVSGISIPNPTRWVADADRLKRDDLLLFNDTIAARDEKNRRDIMAADRAAKGLAPDPVGDRYNFFNQDRTALDARERQGMSNPVIADLVNRSEMMHKGITDIMEHHGFITKQEADRMRIQHRSYLPEGDESGRYRDNFTEKHFPSRGGVEKLNSKVTWLWSQHLEKAFSNVDSNNFSRDMVDHIMEYQRNVPNAVEYLVKVPRPAQLDLGRYITVRRSTGTEYYRSDHNWLHKTLTGENVEKAKQAFDTMGKMKQMLQAGTTGAASMLTGRWVPFRNTLFTAVQAPINATGGVYGGVASRATGTRFRPFTALADIPINLVGGTGAWLVGLEKRISLGLSHMLRPENPNTLTQTIRSIIGDNALQLTSAAMQRHYMNSDFYRSRADGGLGGQSLQQRMRMPAKYRSKGFSWENDDQIIRSQMANLNPSVLIGLNEKSSRPFLINLRRMITEEFTHASEGVHDFLYTINKDNPAFGGDPNQVTRAVRQIVGDPSVSGASPIAQGIRSAVPYSNVIVQGNRAAGRAIAAAPIETIATMVTAYGTLTAAAMITAFASQENLDHYTKDVSAAERAKFMHIYNGRDGERSLVRIPWPSESAWIAPIINELIFNGFNIAAAPHDEGIQQDVLSYLKNVLWHHVDKSTVNGLNHNLNDAFNFLDIPPLVKAGIALTGGSSRIDFARAWDDYQMGNLGVGSFISSPRAPGALPNQSSDDAITHGENGKRWQELASSIFGLAGGLVEIAIGADRYHRQGASWMDSLGTAAQDWTQMAKDLNPMGNTLLWDNAVRLSRVPPIIEESRKALHEMEKTRGARTGERFEGTTGGRNPLEVPAYATDQGKVPDDPTMNRMYFTVSATLTYLNRVALTDINNLEKQMREVNAMMISPEEKRDWTNAAMRRLSDQYRFVAQEVRRLNDDLSQQAGTRVDIRKGIDWQGDVSQFKR